MDRRTKPRAHRLISCVEPSVGAIDIEWNVFPRNALFLTARIDVCVDHSLSGPASDIPFELNAGTYRHCWTRLYELGKRIETFLPLSDDYEAIAIPPFLTDITQEVLREMGERYRQVLVAYGLNRHRTFVYCRVT